MSLIPAEYLRSIVSIGVMNNESSINWIGTGFFVFRCIGSDRLLPFMVTNKHVLQGHEMVYIRLKKENSDELEIVKVELEKNGEKRYSEHPDKNVDVAVVRLSGDYFEQQKFEFMGFDIDNGALTSTEFLYEGFEEGSSVFMLGYPMGLVDIDSNMPICRGGYIARADKKEVQRTKNFLLDIQNFPGNSGSPIITKPEFISVGETRALNRCVLIGIIHSYIPYQESLINIQSNQIVEVRSENSGLAKANPVEFIREVLEVEEKRWLSRINNN